MPRLVALVFTFCALQIYSQQDQVWLHPNLGQWEGPFRYKVELNHGAMFIGPEGFAYSFSNSGEHGHEESEEQTAPSKAHGIKAVFTGANSAQAFTEEDKSPFYRNYILGRNNANWKSAVYSVRNVRSANVWPGVNLEISGGISTLKYSWIVAPGTDPSVIRWKYEGADKLSVNKSGELEILHSLGSITEGKPLAWYLHNGRKKPVKISYVLSGTEVSFNIEEAGISTDTLVIDPTLVFSTFSGSTADNWGFTATPDPNGNLIGAGIAFGQGYPFITGSYENTFGGGAVDIAISKFNGNGSSLIFSTYFGGTMGETPHSIVCAPNGEIYFMGVTGSQNFPITLPTYDTTHNGGSSITQNGIGIGPADIFVARLSANGQNLLSSTYVGGSGTDGINTSSLKYNYGDQFRGEIIVDANSVYVTSVTQSGDFPAVNAFQPGIAGMQDAVAFKMNRQLTAMLWSTFYGGAGEETGHGIQLSSTGNVYITGGTNSGALPHTIGFDLTTNGGKEAYVARLDGATGAFLANTYFGTAEYDQGYFVQLDDDDNVYVYGQTEGTIAITPGRYGTANSGQFIVKFNTLLSNILWTTVVGAGTGHVEISPTAFLVSNCGDIYMTGWGGDLNHSGLATFSTSAGFPVTPDAFQTNTNGNNFWIGVLGEDAAYLQYGTFMGGISESDAHVDGGTSRFDKSGSIYHAVCGSCGAPNNGFTGTPGSWSPTDQASLGKCNMACFKFELNHIEAVIGEPEPLICMPDPVTFTNNSANGNSFQWDFGDNTTSTQENPSHLYSGPGEYTITLIVTDTNDCYSPDTIQFEINIGDFNGGINDPGTSVCPGIPFQLHAYGGSVYQWSPANLLNNANIFNPTATVSETTIFTCIISDSCGVDTVQVTLNVLGGDVEITNDTSVCIGNSLQLEVSGVSTVEWSPATYLNDPSSQTPVSTPENTITYTITGITNDGCVLNEDVTITVETDLPSPVMPDSLSYCEGFSGTVSVSGGNTYAWSPPVAITPLTGPVVTISAQQSGYYYCDFINACGVIPDSVFVSITSAAVIAGNDTTVCPGEEVFMWADGAISYSWDPQVSFDNSDGSLVSSVVSEPVIFTVTGTDANGCSDDAQVTVQTFPLPFIQTVADIYAFVGDEVPLSATSTTPGQYVWSPTEFLSCVVCQAPVANPDVEFTYTVSYVDANGCTASDNVTIHYDPIIYVPNAFTPGENPLNSLFLAVGGNIATFHMEIFDRWGELIFVSDAIDIGWDGTYQDLDCQDGVYTWKIDYSDFTDKEYTMVGHVTLLR